jgi:hypothetical protein
MRAKTVNATEFESPLTAVNRDLSANTVVDGGVFEVNIALKLRLVEGEVEIVSIGATKGATGIGGSKFEHGCDLTHALIAIGKNERNATANLIDS